MSILLFAGSIFEWLATTKTGRIIALVGAVVAFLVIAFFKVKAMGRNEEQERIKVATEKLIKKKEELDAEIGGLSDSDLDKRLRKSSS